MKMSDTNSNAGLKRINQEANGHEEINYSMNPFGVGEGRNGNEQQQEELQNQGQEEN
jgi:hypothetical protein